jgi:lipopolysaccharide/colanic/teichoic acid biosynthesis glycosyltransferase
MQDRQGKVGFAVARGVRATDGNRRPSGLAKRSLTREDILEEPAFQAMLAVERRRAERSSRPFILLLIDASAIEAGFRRTSVVEQLTSAVSDAIRQSDLIGWYRAKEVLGVVFTEVGATEKSSIAEVLYSRAAEAVHTQVEPSLASRVVLTVHVFPENWDSGTAAQVADAKLYPDVAGDSATLPLIIKRAIDILGSAALMLVIAPFLAAIALAIKLTSKGPVIFRQERVGRFGKTFQCLKFRTMLVDNDPKMHREYVQNFIAGKVDKCENEGKEEVIYKIQNDPRVTAVGAFLRRTSLDEFPQFWNVLSGEMSLVGPRPPVPYEFGAYDLWHRRRVLEVKPGVTGLWQVTGRSRTTFADMVRLDLRYCQRWSLWLDLKILLATPLAVVKGSGAC